jgi:hypothetical protein
MASERDFAASRNSPSVLGRATVTGTLGTGVCRVLWNTIGGEAKRHTDGEVTQGAGAVQSSSTVHCGAGSAKASYTYLILCIKVVLLYRTTL